MLIGVMNHREIFYKLMHDLLKAFNFNKENLDDVLIYFKCSDEHFVY